MDERRSKMSRRALLAGSSVAAVGALTGSGAAWAGPEVGSIPVELVNANVNLALNSFSNPLATGTINGKPVHATGSLYGGAHGGPGTITGSLAGKHLAAILTLKDQVPSGSGYVTTAWLTASVGDNALALSGTFNLDAGYNFVSGTITGSDRGLKVDVSTSPYSWAGNIGYGAKITGTYAGSAIAVTAKVPSGPGGSVKGTAGGKIIDLGIQSSEQPGTQLTGTFSGPPELLAVIVGAVAFFDS